MQKQIFEIVSTAKKCNSLWTTDWNRIPTPSAQHPLSSILPLVMTNTPPSSSLPPPLPHVAFPPRPVVTPALEPLKSRGEKKRDQILPTPPTAATSSVPGNNKRPRTPDSLTDANATLLRAKKYQVDEPLPTKKKSQGLNLVFGNEDTIEEADWDDLTIKGTCTDIEKRYFRLIAPPEPSAVRPLHILKLAFERVLAKYKESGDTGSGGLAAVKSISDSPSVSLQYSNYPFYKAYVNDQLKSIRQDLVVQCIRNEFTIDVYETHARIALENRDASEFVQCQTQLEILYSREETKGARKARIEFLSYRFLYSLYSDSSSDAILLLKSLAQEELAHAYIQFAVQARAAYISNNYYSFFTALRPTAPCHLGYMMDLLAHKLRLRSLRIIADAIRPSVPLSALASMLGYRSLTECKDFVSSASGVFTQTDDSFAFDCKSSAGKISHVHELSPEEAAQVAAAQAQAALQAAFSM
jgi:SAC3/GANP family